MKITVMITTRNRCADLRRTLGVLASMNPPADEILVTADGCSDQTVDMVRREYGQCRLWVNEPGLGSIPSRDKMLRAAEGELVVSLDDDSYPLEADFFGKLPGLFDRHPEMAVATFPELRDDDTYWPDTKTPASPGHYAAAYPNGAAVMRRSVYLESGGYPLFFVHSYEEPDYAAQCYALGMAVWFEPDMVIRHHYSPLNRDNLWTHQLNARNELWSVWLRCPWPWLPLVSLFRIWRQFRYAWSEGWVWTIREPLWWWSALRGVGKCRAARNPIPWARYYAWMKLGRQPLHDVKEWDREFSTARMSS